MPAPALLSTSSLTAVRDDLVFTDARLLADPNVATHAKSIQGILTDWEVVQRQQFAHWDAITKAEALVGAADDNLDDFIPVFANSIRSTAGEKSATWNLFFKVTPYEFAAPVLGNQLEAMRRWVQLLAKQPELAAHKKPLEKLIADADAAVKARTEATLANEQFRTTGGLAKFFASMSKTRDTVAAAIDTVAAKSKTLPRNYTSRFFRSRTVKVSVEEKAAKAAKKEAERQAKAQAEAAVKTAQAKVKAAMAELKAAKKTK